MIENKINKIFISSSQTLKMVSIKCKMSVFNFHLSLQYMFFIIFFYDPIKSILSSSLWLLFQDKKMMRYTVTNVLALSIHFFFDFFSFLRYTLQSHSRDQTHLSSVFYSLQSNNSLSLFFEQTVALKTFDIFLPIFTWNKSV